MSIDLTEAIGHCPLIAILRGVRPAEAVAMGEVLLHAGFRIVEVPLNSPEPFDSIRRLHKAFGDRLLIGAGTVLSTEAVANVAEAGGRIIVMPHGDPAVIRAAKAAGMVCTPGVATPTEGFAALAAGADALKLFPAEQLGPTVLKAWRSVFPAGTSFVPVGGITPDNMRPWLDAGAAGFGLGSGLYRKGMSVPALAERAYHYIHAIGELRSRN
ncbi:2-keto-3-deoxy-6-phosphogluconate aldolase [Ameyamaea chiangmaiensis NBRC 103196]|uniref:2-dehydro-3-deoxy-6-phosphogalactonate aldolase n=1 Tax=Ameyamaea chiangmaiensis TaxID=442969 RepID=A0A850PIJ1_9PROT|nr:2-dehydro-3-deoxy-6-phosphogalactonate aldolase [Ameyamaea chiangmaiensis]MBS4074397.1 2-dehydro-3-deoxy-6-phosphogalactonate aldolase [Ameyamaea chiangmaiensis]NVN41061.1 2-dehydro-3-deoxy-6-phosphogalactonate aldolase [Ameyamaea chiangmaiensis]GBQ71894.1 2-keto-3-deoxy-6-phosphogluconate aldolase [Ameyamaea chiangmaiensis NBRC 103196]